MRATLLQLFGIALATVGFVVALGVGGAAIVVGIGAILGGVLLEGERI